MAISRHDSPPVTSRRVGHRELTGWHDHAQHQFLYPSAGMLTVTTRTGSWVVPPRRAMWLPATEPHRHQAHGATEIRGVQFEHDPLGVRDPVLLEVSPLLREAVLALTGNKPPCPEKEALLRALIGMELRPARVPALHLPEPGDDRLRALAAILHAAPGDQRALAELGAAVGASERTLSRLFHRELGTTFPRWRGQLRLLHAAIALAEGRSVTGIADEFGYSSPSAFIAAFRATFGSTPGAYQAATR
ncbi:AraC family transcriptional regulator [Sciscionella sediminilitoris]|uniref:AraC family transcriptional regulator n=1 Tax=Sciscionella sediminilitoris TaxID=1445613 RepID=UPI0004DFB231|nr:helix-turn-helix transcriptional regulator [Sciscionella sp. SE31]